LWETDVTPIKQMGVAMKAVQAKPAGKAVDGKSARRESKGQG
jgi:hypothetical protein